jgi:2-oxoglutarate ferredoxin oxidoreductase subunit beta
MVTTKDYESRSEIDWCAGCGNFGIINALKKTLVDLELEPSDVVVVSGIGCSAKTVHFMNVNGFHTIHGRALPVATGIRLASDGLKVIAVTGDGDGMSIGGAHFINSTRRNVDMTHLLHNNAIYGLTTGQVAPTSAKGMRTKTTPHGSPEKEVQPVPLSLVCGATFVARTYVGNFKHMVATYKAAITHRGYSFVDTLQPCVTFNKVNTYDWYNERVYHLEDEGHDPSEFRQAMIAGYEWGERIPLGVFYQVEEPTLDEQLVGLRKGPLSKRDVSDVDIDRLMATFS